MGQRIPGNQFTQFDPSRFEVVETVEQPAKQQPPPQAEIDPSRFEVVQQIEPQKPVEPKQAGLGEQALDVVIKVGEALDSVTGAPTRAFIERLQSGDSVLQATERFIKQFGDTEGAPTGKDIARNAGVSDDELVEIPGLGPISKSGAVGFMIELLADPTNVIPGTAVLKGVGKTGAVAANATAKTARKATPQFIKRSVKSSSEALKTFFSPQRAPDYDDLLTTAAKLGIEPNELNDVVEFGERSLIGRSEIARRAGPAGEMLQREYEEVWQKVARGLGDKIVQVSGGSSLSPDEAGDLIRAAYRESAENILNNNAVTYRGIARANPDLRISDDALDKFNDVVENLVEEAEETLRFAGTIPSNKKAALNLLDNVSDLRTGAFASADQFARAMQNVGRTAFANKGFNPDFNPDIHNLKNLYFAAREALVDTYKKKLPNGAEVVKNLEANNKALTQFFTDQNVVARVIENPRMGPENVFNALMKRDTQNIKSLRNIIDPAAFDSLKATVLNEIIGLGKLGMDEKVQEFSFQTLQNNMRRKQTILKEIFDGDELAEIAEIVQLGARLGPIDKSPPAAGMSGVFKNLTQAIQDALVNDAIIEQQKSVARYGGLGEAIKQSKAGRIVEGTGDFFGFSQRDASELPLLFQRYRAPTARDISGKGLQMFGAGSQEDTTRPNFGIGSQNFGRQ